MAYRGKHGKPTNRAKARFITIALAMASSTLAVPLTTTTVAKATDLRSIEGLPAWAMAPDITVNPPGPGPGQAVAPAVNRGYVITGDQLQRFNITATPEGQQEIQAFVESIKQAQGITLDAKAYNAFATPPIIYLSFDDLAGKLARLVASAQAVVTHASDPATLNVLLTTIEEQMPVIHHHEPTVPDLSGVAALVNNVVALAADLINNPPVTPPTTGELVAMVDQLTLMVDALLANLGFETSAQIAEDPTHVAPVGTDPVNSVYDGVLGDVLVLPVGAGLGTVAAAWDDGVMQMTTILETTPLASLSPMVGSLTQYGPGDAQWDPAGGQGCARRKSNNTAWYDTCQWWYHLAKDGNADRQTWSLMHYGTGKSKGAWKLNSLEVRSWRKTGTPDQDWIDWSPRADEDHGNCSSSTVGVNVNAAYLEHTSTHCDLWNIDKGAEPADFANVWMGNVRRSEREVAGLIATNTPNNYVPVDYIRYDYYARP